MSLLFKPFIIDFPQLGDSSIGFTTMCERVSTLHFPIKRVFWIYNAPENTIRGNHAHYVTEQVIVAVSGAIQTTVELRDGAIEVFHLNSPSQGLYIPASSWHTMKYSSAAIQLVLASHAYDESDYIRNYEDYKKIWT